MNYYCPGCRGAEVGEGLNLPSAPPTKQTAQRVSSVALGTRLWVWWDYDQKWYSGTVRDYNQVNDSHLIVYDDGEQRHDTRSG